MTTKAHVNGGVSDLFFNHDSSYLEDGDPEGLEFRRHTEDFLKLLEAAQVPGIPTVDDLIQDYKDRL